MSKTYDHITAAHYSAFRPTLHRPILSRCISEKKRFGFGLDIGCGTGQSSIALADYCTKVIAIDPSEEMLGRSIAHPKVEYHIGDAQNLDFTENHFDIVTFAGSLYYAKSQKLLDEILRVSKPSAKVIVYDFEILLADILLKLDVEPDEKKTVPYNHQEDFSGLQKQNLKRLDAKSEQIAFEIQASNLVHLILSEKETYECLSSRLGHEGLYNTIKNRLVQLSNGENLMVKANLFFTVYECDKNN